MNADRYPFRFRVKAAVRSAWACLRGDQTVQRVQRTAELDRSETEKADLRAEVRELRSRLAHPSNQERGR